MSKGVVGAIDRSRVLHARSGRGGGRCPFAWKAVADRSAGRAWCVSMARSPETRLADRSGDRPTGVGRRPRSRPALAGMSAGKRKVLQLGEGVPQRSVAWLHLADPDACRASRREALSVGEDLRKGHVMRDDPLACRRLRPISCRWLATNSTMRYVHAQETIRLASPFIGKDVARDIVAQPLEGRAGDRRLLTAVTERSVSAGALSPSALAAFLERGWNVKSIPNLHAKLYLVDQSWGLVGSGNLTGAGIARAGPRAGNIELGVRLSETQRATASDIFDEWWFSVNAETVTPEKLQLHGPGDADDSFGNRNDSRA